MNGKLVGRALRELRVQKEMTQSDLACDGLTQPMISNIENGYTKSISYKKIDIYCNRLGVGISYVHEQTLPNYEYEKVIFSEIRKAKDLRDYIYLFDVIHSEEKILTRKVNSLITPMFNQQIQWNKGICYFYVHEDYEKAVYTIKKALEITAKGKNKKKFCFTERECEMLSSLGAIYLDAMKYKEAKNILEYALKQYNTNPKPINKETKTKILFNLSKLYSEIGEFGKAINICFDGLSWCKQTNSNYLYGEFLFNIAENQTLSQEFDLALDRIHHTKNFFVVHEDFRFMSLVEAQIKKIHELIK